MEIKVTYDSGDFFDSNMKQAGREGTMIGLFMPADYTEDDCSVCRIIDKETGEIMHVFSHDVICVDPRYR